MSETDDIDADTLARMREYFGAHDPRVPREISVDTLKEFADSDWTPDEFLALIREAVEAIPEDSRATSEVTLEGGYEEPTVLTITYRRMETPEEIAAKVKKGLEYARQSRARDLAREMTEYKRLKAKFGSSSSSPGE